MTRNKSLNSKLNVKLSLGLTKTWRRILYLTEHHAMKMYVGVEVQFHAFLTSAALRPGEEPPVPIG
jgi:hypothetical protein